MNLPVRFVGGVVDGRTATWKGGDCLRVVVAYERYDFSIDEVVYGPFGCLWYKMLASYAGLEAR